MKYLKILKVVKHMLFFFLCFFTPILRFFTIVLHPFDFAISDFLSAFLFSPALTLPT